MVQSLEFRGVGKAFPGVQALSDVSFQAKGGEVHALMGENGAGKSTLLKILSGDYHADEGAVYLNGQEQRFRNTHEAIEAGIAVIYQELQLVPQLTVAENMFLGSMPAKWGWTNRAKMIAEARRILEWMQSPIRPEARISTLSISQRQVVELAKALSHNAQVVAFDEPTSSLGEHEVEQLFRIIGELRKEGRILIYVSHRMDEIAEIGDAATILRDGRLVETISPLDNVDSARLVEAMVGRPVDMLGSYRPRPVGEVAMRVDNLVGPGLKAPASLAIREGEIVGLFGLMGAGRTELVKLLAGAERSTSGTVTLGAGPLRASIRDRLSAGIGLCPEDRKKEAIIPIASVQDNINLGVRSSFAYGGFVINLPGEKENAIRQATRFNVRAANLFVAMKGLSGGNQQKVVLGRTFGRDLKVVLLDEPTRGIDVGAKQEIHEHIRRLAESGVSTLVVSSELPELLALCDRMIVMCDGRITGELPHSEATQQGLLALALPTAEAS